MTTPARLRILAAIATPFDAGLAIREPALHLHARWLLDQGCDGLVLFGTTGESASLTGSERRHVLERLVGAGIAPERLIVGTGCSAIDDTVELTRHALATGCTRVLVHPPFFFKGVSDRGLAAYYDRVIERVRDDRVRVYLYHFPQAVGASVSVALAAQLCARYPQLVVGYKDSSGDWQNTLAVLRECPALDVYAGSEGRYAALRAAGGAGCISATANLQAAAICEVERRLQSGGFDELQARVSSTRAAMENFPMIAAVKSALARIHGDDAWRNLRPPLLPLAADQERAVYAALAASP